MSEAARPSDLQELLDALSSISGSTDDAGLGNIRGHLHALARARMTRADTLRQNLDSEDLTQEAMFTLTRNLHLFRGSTWPEFFRFVESILHRRKTDLARHHARLRRRSTISTALEAVDQLPAHQASPDGSLLHAEDLEQLRNLVDELPSESAAILRLRIDGLEYPAIAARLGISEPAARKRISRAIADLRRRWSEESAE